MLGKGDRSAPMATGKQPLIDLIIHHGNWEKTPASGKGEFIAWCPWHDDNRPGGKPSLKVNNVKNNGRGIVKCMSGRCGKGGLKALVEEWGLLRNGSDIPPWDREIENAYDYRDAKGELVFQVIRFKVPPGANKDFIQRQPDPERNGRWQWNMKGVKKILYRLPELRAAPLDGWVFVGEGEKDADRVADEGLVATTNAGGAGNWHKSYAREFAGRKVAVLRDNDQSGLEYQTTVCKAIHGIADTVKAVELPGLPEKGDISDWLDAGHNIDELMAILTTTPPYEPPPPEQITTAADDRPDWNISPKRSDAIIVTDRLAQHGSFVTGDDQSYYFDRDRRQLITLHKDNMRLKVLLTDRYQINFKDPLYDYLVSHLQVEALARGENAVVRNFSYYDRDNNVVLLDMGDGNVLKISADNIEVRENGADGVVFKQMTDHDPWRYRADAPDNILYEQMIAPVNFADEGTYTVEQQKLLLLLWMLSMAFESLMKTRPITMAVGPPESGKSSLFRYIGQMLLGADFDVDTPMQDAKGEEQFWTNVSNSVFVCYDDVNSTIRWMAEAIARVATGTRQSKRTLQTTNELSRFPVRCMLAITAMTPSYVLRSGFVASRAIIFTMQPLIEKREEYEIEAEIVRNRDFLLSDYAKMVQKALQVPMDTVVVADPGMRLMDFQRVATRLGMGLGMEAETHQLFTRFRDSQALFATEEDSIAVCLEIWVSGHKPIGEDEQAEMLNPILNNGRKALTSNLHKELTKIASDNGITLFADTPMSLGRQLAILKQALSRTYDVNSGKADRTAEGRGSWWQFTRKDVPVELDEDES